MRTTTAAAVLGLALSTLLLVPARAAAPAHQQAPSPSAAAGAPKPAPGSSGKCAAGELCLWQKEQYQGKRLTFELSSIDIESCVPLAGGASAHALANRTGRPVTTYQSAECAETGEFETYPGGGTWLPQSPYRVRAFKVWEN
ncbi:peptidase inhibitor family I36 protein [Streptomyces sp. NPDC007088]|uniref:peptidase inhibitor family I36 protein n=1 Tax=Streptomyces sp. NPDC007088 TaxID=3364773 RepID=UPI0036B35343